MYNPAHFQETDPEAIAQLVSRHPLATLISVTQSGLTANYTPLIWRDGRLIGHISAANDLHRDIADGAEVLAIFHGDDQYISPNWYPSKAATHEVVPTWNYQVVHMHGRIQFSHSEAAKRRIVHMLTDMMEPRINGDAAWKMGDAPDDFLRSRLADIVGLEIEVTRVEAKSKLSQNRKAEDYAAVTDQMEVLGQNGLHKSMQRHASD